jgi:RNA:NAD 2'-phosphotransferase (TPT1/KptA family)
MADDIIDAPQLTAEQYRERAKLVRQTAAATTSRLRRQGLLDTARRYEELADNSERARSSG